MDRSVSPDQPIYVTKSFMPPRDEFDAYVDKIWESNHLTNKGPLLLEFENRIRDQLKLDNFQFVANGTLALQLAIDGLGITGGEIITTPFSYVATTSAILWQRCSPVFVDIDEQTLCIDADKIEASITESTRAILAVHVFGNVCEVEKIESIAKKHNLRVIYDAAHAFGASYKGKSVLDYGDVSIVSFHATKLFHTIEGGGIVAREENVRKRIDLAKRFGHNADTHIQLGINAKANEFQAAMGLANLPYLASIISDRRMLSDSYDEYMQSFGLGKPKYNKHVDRNYAYYPVIFESEQQLVAVMESLEKNNIFMRRYFYPSLNKLPYIDGHKGCPISGDIASRIACLPLYYGLEVETVRRVTFIIEKSIAK